MATKVKITKHAKTRLGERTAYNTANYADLAKVASRSGYAFSKFKDPLFSFLKERTSNNGAHVAKVYDRYVFIFDNVQHQLVTVFEIPEKYLPIEDYLLATEEYKRCWIVMTSKADGSIWYWSNEQDGPTQDLANILEFKNQVTATNYMTNNALLKTYKRDYNIEVY